MRNMLLIVGLIITATAGAQEVKTVKSAKIKYEIRKAGKTSIGIYDKDGTLVRHIVTGQKKTKGEHAVQWDGRNNLGNPVPPGEYEFRGVAGNVTPYHLVDLGNSGKPSRGRSKVMAGYWTSVATSGRNNSIVGVNYMAEGGIALQCYDESGQVLWRHSTGQVPNIAVTADSKYVYVLKFASRKTGKDNFVRTYMLSRINAKTGQPALWPGDKMFLEVAETSYVKSGNQVWKDWEIRDIEAVDGKIYLPLHSEKTIKVLDRETGKTREVIKLDENPGGVAVCGDGGILVSHDNGAINKYSPKGGFIRTIIKELDEPWDVDIDGEGNIYVSELGDSNWIRKFTTDGKFIRSFGIKSGKLKPTYVESDRKRFVCPLSICINGKGVLYIADFGKARIAVIDENGEFLDNIAAYSILGNSYIIGILRSRDGLKLYVEQHAGIAINSYDLGKNIRKKDWEQEHYWHGAILMRNSAPPLVAQINGKTYLINVGGNIAVNEIQDDALVFCSLLARRGNKFLDADLEKDAEKLGLLEDAYSRKKKYLGRRLRCKIAWTDSNRDGRMQKNEVEALDEDTDGFGFYPPFGSTVDNLGNLYFKQSCKGSRQLVWKFEIQGVDHAGNPIYSWKNRKKLFDSGQHEEEFGKKDTIVGLERDERGNLYFSKVTGNHCYPLATELLSYDENGNLRWRFGRKQEGFKDEPGEYHSNHVIGGIADGCIFPIDYHATVDVITLDGLYVETLLMPASLGLVRKGMKEDVYTNPGETFTCCVYKDPKDGIVYLTLSSRHYLIPVYRIDGLDKLERFRGKVLITEKMQKGKMKRTTVAYTGIPYHKKGYIYRLKNKITVDGNLKEWPVSKMRAQKTSIPGKEDVYHTKLYAGYDKANLYLGVKVAEPTPAANDITMLTGLWQKDALELLMSTKVGHTGRYNWKNGDRLISIAADGRAGKCGKFESYGGKAIASIDKAFVCTRIWDNKKGYDLEAVIPWKSIKWPVPESGGMISWEWDIMLGGEHKMYWTVPVRAGNPQRTENMETAYFVELGDVEETAVIKPAKLAQAPNFKAPFTGWPKNKQLTVNNGKFAEVYSMDLYAGYTDKALFLRAEVLDPDPAINTAGASHRWNTGDGVNLFFNRRRFYVPAISKFTEVVYTVSGSDLTKIKGTEACVKAYDNGKGYSLFVKIPWTAIGGLSKARSGIPFNVDVMWSDAEGGGLWNRVPWRKKTDGGEGILRLSK